MSHTFSLSRAQKHVERLHAEHTRILEQQETLLSPVLVNVSGDEAKAEKHIIKFKALGATAQGISDAATTIRLAIAAKNGLIGIHEKLAERASLNRQIRLLEGLYAKGLYQSASALEVDQVPAYMARTANLTALPTIRVKVFNEGVQAEMEQKISKLKMAEMRVGDDINDLNQQKISVEISDEVAALIGM